MRTIPVEVDDLLQRLLDAADELDDIAYANYAQLLREAALCLNTVIEGFDVRNLREVSASNAAE
jgi:hypothetical protein